MKISHNTTRNHINILVYSPPRFFYEYKDGFCFCGLFSFSEEKKKGGSEWEELLYVYSCQSPDSYSMTPLSPKTHFWVLTELGVPPFTVILLALQRHPGPHLWTLMGLLTGPGSKPRVGKMLTGRLFAL
jgi:hypothetical protein